jgi:hypothetical protein
MSPVIGRATAREAVLEHRVHQEPQSITSSGSGVVRHSYAFLLFVGPLLYPLSYGGNQGEV